MSDREEIKTSKEEIVNHWMRREDECGLSVDLSEAHERCWRCGCHLDNPNVADSEVIWDWIRAYDVAFYDTFWTIHGMIEYERIYGISIHDELEKREIVTDEKQSEFKQILSLMCEQASWHFGEPHFNIATTAGIFRMTFKEYDRRHGRETEKNIQKWVLTKNFV